ncbi:MAG: DUF4236 domain-containing protein [Oscillospiraceae bacterium]|nr:DUF4236 domain-containing protein [Oscillospiraceae bacterium]
MGLRFRKSFNIGPLRINISKSGIGFSLGVKGFRVSRSAKGKMTATASLPGTGLSYVQDLDKESIEETIEDVKDLFDGDDGEKKESKSTKKINKKG